MADIGVQMFTLRNYTQTEDDLKRTLEKVSDIGYESIQVSAFGKIDPERTRALAEEFSLQIGGTHVGWDRFKADLDDVIAEHKLWKCRHTAVGMIPPQDYLSMDGLTRFLDELAPIATGLAEAGISFSYHHHAHEFLHFEGKPWLAHLFEQAPPEQLNIEIDTHWVVAGGGDPIQWIHNCGQRMPLLHLKDFTLNAEYKRQFAAIGDGNLNWDGILSAAEQYPIDYYFIEQDNCYGEDEFDCLARSFNFLSRRGMTE